MNNGFFGFPQPSRLIKVKQFDSSGVYIIPPGTESLYVLLISGGAGGGGGRVGAVSTNRYGGGGGGSGAAIEAHMPLAALNLKPEQQLFVLIGLGGAGGLGGQTNDSNGSNGSAGTGSKIVTLSEPSNISNVTSSSFGVLFATNSSAGVGQGGTATTSSGSNWAGGISYGSTGLTSFQGGIGGNLGTPTNADVPARGFWSLSGLGGGGASIANIYGTGNYFRSRPANDTMMGTHKYSVGNIDIERQTNLEEGKHANSFRGGLWGGEVGTFIGPAFGGVGGGANNVGNGFNGGNGFRGSGGGGGGAAVNGFLGGNGGKGGNGYCLIIAYGVFS